MLFQNNNFCYMLEIVIIVSAISLLGQSSSNRFSHRHQHHRRPSLQPRVGSLDSEIDDTVKVFKRNVLRLRNSTKLDLIFLIDASYSVRLNNFKDEVRFVSRFVGGIPVSMDTTRVAVITFADEAQIWIDQVTANNVHDHKCSLLGTALPAIKYASGSTYTLGALEEAENIMKDARRNSKKVILLITDGRSNGGDPTGIARRLKNAGVEIFTFGVLSGDVNELTYMASDPKRDHVYILESFAEFESVARRALLADAEVGDYVTEEDRYCDRFCTEEGTCCHSSGACRCGTTTGLYECVCNAGYFGLGLLPEGCLACPANTYKPFPTPGGPETCIPCPDSNMVSPNGSSSLDECTCTSGYLRMEGHCDIIRCPEIARPANGRFEGLFCDNRYRSTCRVFCNEGYDLVGSETFECTLDGSWRMEDDELISVPYCQIRHCPELLAPLHGLVNCSKSDFSYQTQCTLACELGFALQGSAKRYCQADKEWDGTTGQCEEIRCRPPLPPMGGSISSNCIIPSNATLPFGEVCYFSCSEGYALSILNQTACINTNTWSTDSSHAKCIDIEPPVVECPDDLEMRANPTSTSTSVSWEPANVLDNSNNVSLIMIPEVELPALFHVGQFNITYRAVDQGGLTAFCNFLISILDYEPPMIDDCSSPKPFVIPSNETTTRFVTWNEPTFTDNSGFVVVNGSRSYGILPLGQTHVLYEARDPTGNVRACAITISVQHELCSPLRNPIHGKIDCETNSQGLLECILECIDDRYGMVFREIGYPSYQCTKEGEWAPLDPLPRDCSHQRYVRKTERTFRFNLNMGQRNTCYDENFLLSVKEKAIEYLTPRISTWCETELVDINCTLLSVTVECLREELPTISATTTESISNQEDNSASYYYYDYDNQRRKKRSSSKIFKKFLRRIKRQLSRGDEEPEPYDYNTEEYSSGYSENYGDTTGLNSSNVTASPLTITAVNQVSDEAIQNILNDSNYVYKLEVTFVIGGEISQKNERKEHQDMREFIGTLQLSSDLNNDFARISVDNLNSTSPEILNIDPTSYLPSDGDEMQCPLGTVLQDPFCVNCPVGSYYDVKDFECKSCEIGFYQDVEAQIFCKPCPEQTSTSTIHARSVEECKHLCGTGRYSFNGYEPCISCPFHTFGDTLGAIECIRCPENFGTSIRGATTEEQCSRFCEKGHASVNGFEPCHPCPEDTYQYQEGSDFCLECPAGTTTNGKASISFQNCTGIVRLISVLSLDALENEESVQELIINTTRPFSDCYKDPCRNGGSCIPAEAGHLCECQSGFTGSNCEIDINECSSDPCENNAECLDLENEFQCVCVDGYEGSRCQFETDECESSPCLNNASCVDQLGSFQCVCSDGFEGIFCENNINECALEPCLNGGSCQDGIARFYCVCPPGYSGPTCEVDVDECSSNPCENDAICNDGINNFTCQCAKGFEGRLCEINIDDCFGNQCQNGSSCVDLIDDFKCVCTPSFSGRYCDTKVLPDFDLVLTKPNTYHHVELRDGIGNMTEVTAAFYMKSNNSETSGTPFSYAVGSGPLADVFTLTNLEALTLYVNGEAVVTDTRKLNNGRWHHIVVTWKSEGGEWQIYVNNVLEVEGSGLQTNTVIPGGGILVIGQEQDCLGGCFSSSQEFIGTITQFNFYDYVMTASDVNFLHNHCVDNQGTVKAWPDALGGIVGQIQIVRPQSFCSPCLEFEPSPHLDIEAINSYTKGLSCEIGFDMYFRVSSSRKVKMRVQTPRILCRRDGNWYQGVRKRNDPSNQFVCQRRKCGKHSNIEFGTATATGKEYNDTVHYTCNEGFKLEGAASAVCQADQSWSSASPSCVDINECLSNPCHEMATCSNFRGSYSCVCHFGYTGNGFTCLRINCGDPGVVANGQILGTNYTSGAVVYFSCDVGYEIGGSDSRTCLDSGYWSNSNPSCHLIECLEIPELSNGIVTVTSKFYLGTLTHQCNLGYELIGLVTRTCLVTGDWSGEAPVCSAVKCSDPAPVQHASISLNLNRRYQYNDAILYECDLGYRLNGTATLHCNELGLWQGSVPACMLKSCGQPNSIPNGSFEASGYSFNDTVSYSCDDGYRLIGQSTFWCLSSEVWGHIETDSIMDEPVCSPLPCPPPMLIPNSDYELTGADDFEYGSYVKYNCVNGYFPVGNSKIFCQADARWNISENFFECDPVPCNRLANIENGKIRSDYETNEHGLYVFGQSIQFGCNEGFYRVGDETSLCQATGSWTNFSIACEPVYCEMPPAEFKIIVELVDGPHSPGPRFESMLQYSCQPGYDLIDSHLSNRACGADGQWTGNPLTCEMKDCGPPPTVSENGYRIGTNTTFGSEIVYLCNEGYYTDADSNTIQCTEEGEWSPSEMAPCFPIECSQPNETLHGSFTGDDFTFLQSITYSCDRGFFMVGTSVLTCLADETWSDSTPRCQPVDCGMLPEIDYGYLQIETTVYQSTANYSCSVGYEIHGEATLKCLWISTWNSIPPFCMPVDCGPIEPILNGFVLGNNTHFNGRAYFLCDIGYTLQGNNQTVCTASREWSNPTPNCSPVDCGAPLSVSNARLNGNGNATILNTQINYICVEGFEFENDVFSITCQENGRWSGPPSCAKIRCGNPNLSLHGKLVHRNKSYYEFQDTAAYICDVGYDLVGNQNIACQADKSWSSSPPACQPVDCGYLAPIANGTKTGNSTTFQSTITYQCEEGYETLDSVTLRCLHTSAWSDKIPTCLPVSCGQPPNLLHGRYTGENNSNSKTFLSEFNYSCDSGYYIVGPRTAQCSSDRSWHYKAKKDEPFEGVRPNCRRVTCTFPPLIQHGSSPQRNYTYGENVVFECDEGYEKVENPNTTFVCSAEDGGEKGFYAGFPPTCLPVSCLPPQNIRNGYLKYNGSSFQDEAIYYCNEGYFLSGTANSQKSICQANRQWSNNFTCLPRNCGPPPFIANSRNNLTVTTFPTSVQYQCNAGYINQGPDSVKCLSNGNWSDSSDIFCDPVSCGEIPEVNNSTYTNTGNVYGDSATFSCENGFNLVPPTKSNKITIRCRTNGKWDGITFACHPISCNRAKQIPHGFSRLSYVYYLDKVEYVCDRGYEMNGSSLLQCLSNGRFSSAPPVCSAVVCGLPPPIANSRITFSGDTFRHDVTYECDLGHSMNSGQIETAIHHSVCSENGQWYPPPPASQCSRVVCPQPPQVDNGIMLQENNKSQYVYGDAVMYDCNLGYELHNNLLSILCQADKSWSALPRCDPVDCGLPPCPRNAVCSESGLTYGQRSSIQCIPGFEIIPSVTSFEISCQDNARWSLLIFNQSEIDTTSCNPHFCERPEDISDGSYALSNEDTRFGAAVKYTCDPGYEMTTDSHSTLFCTEEKTWGHHSLPRCIAKDCGLIRCPEKATCSGDGTIFGSEYHIVCDIGHEIVAFEREDFVLQCLETGQWSEQRIQDIICTPVSCPIPPNLLHGRIISYNDLTSNEYQQNVTYECDVGYNMRGSNVITCQANKSYAPDPPICIPVSCGLPSKIQFGSVEKSGVTFMNTANFMCDPGYELKGNSFWICSSRGFWAPENEDGSGSGFESSWTDTGNEGHALYPRCDPIPCGEAPGMDNGYPLNGSQTVMFKQTVAYICDDGFLMMGPGYLSCMEDGQFSAEINPACKRLSCEEPPEVENAHKHAYSVSGGTALNVFGDRVVYSCINGFEFSSSLLVVEFYCSSNGVWLSNQIDTCVPISCGPPPAFENNVLEGFEYTFNNTIQYTCEIGYELVGPSRRVCLSNRQWSYSEQPSRCHPVHCPAPSFIDHGHFSGNYTFMSEVTYECDYGYELDIDHLLDQSSRLICQANRQWDKYPPKCQPISCGTPLSVPNSNHSGTYFSYGSEVVFACNAGFEMQNDPVILCQGNGKWTVPYPECQSITCVRPPFVRNSHYQMGLVTFGNTVTYQCNEGYYLQGPSDTLTCTSSKTFDFPPPLCLPVSCGFPETTQNGYIESISGVFTFMHNATYHCYSGYEITHEVSSTNIICDSNGDWSEKPPTCTPVKCGIPPGITNATVQFDSDSYLAIAAYQCQPGYEMQDHSPHESCSAQQACLTCQADRQWRVDSLVPDSFQMPHCERLSCGEPPRIDYGRVVYGLSLFESKAVYSCEKGFELFPSNDLILTCGSNHNWEPNSISTCRKIACPQPDMIENGYFTIVLKPTDSINASDSRDSAFFYEDSITYECNRGYKLAKNQTNVNEHRAICTERGQWDKPTPTCETVVCIPLPPLQRHGNLLTSIKNTYTYKEAVLYQCDDGYEISDGVRNESLICEDNGRWSKATFSLCKPVSCGNEPHVSHAEAVNEKNSHYHKTFGEVVRYRCLNGYYMIGNDEIRCTANKMWSTKPSCEPVSCNLPPTVEHGYLVHSVTTKANFESNSDTSNNEFQNSGDTPAISLPIQGYTDIGSNEEDSHESLNRNRRSSNPNNESENTGFVFKDVVRYQCERGYNLRSTLSDSLTCLANGQWSMPHPLCEAIQCQPPPQIQHGHRKGNQFEFGKTITYECLHGFETHENEILEFICDETGYFLPITNRSISYSEIRFPVCLPVSCGLPPVVLNGMVTNESYFVERVFQDTIHYACNLGYNIQGPSELTCLANKQFSRPPPSCEPVSCGPPPPLTGSTSNYSDITYTHTATYKCAQGYNEGTDKITCMDNGRWSRLSLRCNKVDCRLPPSLEFGSFDITGTKYQDTARYRCFAGYNINGIASRTCLATGNWSPGRLRCDPVLCEAPPNPQNGFHIAMADYSFRNSIAYYCNKGFVLNGNSSSTCNELGHWSNPVPECERLSCGQSPTVQNSIQLQTELLFEEKLFIECDFGYLNNGDNYLECTSSGELSGEPSCLPVSCENPPVLENGRMVSEGGYVFGDFIIYECNNGHEFSSEQFNVECSGNGTFVYPSDVTCNPVECPTLRNITHGSLSSQGRKFRETVSYYCDDGYYLEGSDHTTCTATKEWSSTPPTCLPVSCGPPPVFENSIISDAKLEYTFEMTVRYNCIVGHRMTSINGHEIKCNADGTYSESGLVCEIVTCPEFVPVTNGRYYANGLEYLSEGELVCVDGYQLNTGEEVVNFYCQANAFWSRDFSVIRCLPISCDPHPVVRNSRVEVLRYHDELLNGLVHDSSPTNLHYKDQLIYTCDHGYSMQGLSSLKCQSNGKWDSQPGVCNPVVCGTPPNVSNAETTGDLLTYGMEAIYTCKKGFVKASSSMTKTCTANGSFSTNVVECELISCSPLPVIENGNSSALTGFYGDQVTYECDKGFHLVGEEILHCNSEGSWAPAPPQCVRVQCAEFPRIQFSYISTTGNKYEDVLAIDCVPGFEPSLDSEILSTTCEDNGEWSTDLTQLRCLPISCEYIAGIENGDIVMIPPLHRVNSENQNTKLSHVFETRLLFECHFGHELRGQPMIVCEADKHWSTPPPSCTPIQCHEPPRFEHALLRSNIHTFGQHAEYECETGYVLMSSRNSITCNENRTYGDYEIVCSPKPCSPPQTIENGRIVPLQNFPVYGDQAEVLCDDGYYATGEDQIECLSDGMWSDISSTCLPVECGAPPLVSNSILIATDPSNRLSFGEKAVYECKPGYHTSRENLTITCLADGQFEETSDQCNRIVCSNIPQLENAVANSSQVAYGEALEISCNLGYEFSNQKNQITAICQGKEEWSEELTDLQCKGVKCETLERLEFGLLEPFAVNGIQRSFTNRNETSYPASVIHRCNYGYVLMGQAKRDCLTDGTWEGNVPYCQPVDCGVLPRLLHGFINKNTTTFGSAAAYSCEVGYRLEPSTALIRRCQATGSWSGIAPRCRLLNCGVHSEIENAILSNEGEILYGLSVTIVCKKGYNLVGDFTRTCGPNGTFVGTTPACEIVSCGLHPVVPNGIVTPQLAFLYQESVNISCEVGFLLVSGNSQRTCLHDGQWSGTSPICEYQPASIAFDSEPQALQFGISCERPDLSNKNVKIMDENFSEEIFESGTELKFCCSDSRFMPVHSTMTSTCENGEWSKIPECLPRCRHKCLHNGKCSQSGKCSCTTGWTGSKCHRPFCPLPCLNGGYCSASFRCSCTSGWTGLRCSSAECIPNCSNGGKCIGPNLCQCPYGYFGKDCSESFWFNSLW